MPGDGDWVGLNHLAVLHVDAPNLREVASVGAVGGFELSDDRNRFGRVDGVRRVRAKEVGVAKPVRGKVPTILVAHAGVTLVSVVVAARGPVAPVLARGGARVRGDCLRD